MVSYPKEEIVKKLKIEYPVGTKVKLICMNDPYTYILSGTIGEVKYVDDIGTIHVNWENGRSLGVAYGVDKCEKIK